MKSFTKSNLVAILAALTILATIVLTLTIGDITHSYAASPAKTIDLKVIHIETLTRPLCAGSSPTFRAFIKNIGSTSSGNFDIQWNADGQIFNGGHFSIPAGTLDTHDHIWQNIASGKHTLTFIADFDQHISESNEKNNQLTQSFTVENCGSADVALSAPFSNGVTFKAIQGYYNNQGTCNIRTAPDHCDNQLFGLDLVPDQSDKGKILAPVGGKVEFLPAHNNAFCLGLTLDDGIHLNLCHFAASSWGKLKTGDRVLRGQVLGKRGTAHIHISLDDRRDGRPYIPVPFNGAHTLEGMALGSDHDNNGVVVSYGQHLFMVEIQEWQGLTGTSSNIPIPK